MIGCDSIVCYAIRSRQCTLAYLHPRTSSRLDSRSIFNITYKPLTNSVYLPPRPTLLNPRLAMAADKPCWTEPSESGTYGDCKVLRRVVNSKFGRSDDGRGRIGCSCANFRHSLMPGCRATPQIQTSFPPHGRSHPQRMRTLNCRGKRESKRRGIMSVSGVARAASWAGSAASPETPLRGNAGSSATRCPPPAA